MLKLFIFNCIARYREWKDKRSFWDSIEELENESRNFLRNSR